jgi:glucose-6-phosphate isomerase
MIDLNSYGIGMRFDEETMELTGFKGKRDVRKLEDMRGMFMEPDEGIKDLYYMFRGVDSFDSIRYDVTALLPGMVGEEYIKTKGHYHPDAYPEVYEVMKGKAFYLLQRSDDFESVDDVILVEAEERDIVVIPPHYGHVTVNRGDGVLIMSNLVSSRFSSVYEPYERKKGAAYYITVDGVVRNGNYGSLPHVRRAKPREARDLGVVRNRPLYTSIKNERDAFGYLEESEEYDFSGVFEFE